MYRLIDRIEQISEAEFTKENLNYRTRTGQGRTKKNEVTKRNETTYRAGRLTAIGDIEEKVWREAVFIVIKKRNDQLLFDALKEHFQNDPSPIIKKQYEEWALDAYVSELYNNPKWVGYEEFFKTYYKI